MWKIHNRSIYQLTTDLITHELVAEPLPSLMADLTFKWTHLNIYHRQGKSKEHIEVVPGCSQQMLWARPEITSIHLTWEKELTGGRHSILPPSPKLHILWILSNRVTPYSVLLQ
ncbi:hypothetical protein XELAEV_18011894mg [Xenopus laevis]|uniref:Uncharacterized protein n=1 Tax=Xenopus laevis TaxID=8355 RepID=A0A974DMQ5_XENLA|nr:hypothetical protein XELAEV_18011894mg [Xenopus laevis]